MARIVNVDVLDDREPHILVQRYIFDDRTLLVFRKPTEEDHGDFHVSPGIVVDRHLNWAMEVTLFDTAEDLEGEDVLEQFALVYRDEDNPPSYDPNYRSGAVPYASIVYDPEDGCYRCEPVYKQYHALADIAQQSFKATLYFTVHELHDLLAQNGD